MIINQSSPHYTAPKAREVMIHTESFLASTKISAVLECELEEFDSYGLFD